MGQGTPLQFIPIGAFMGTDEGIPSLELAAVFSSGGNRNTYLDKLGRARTILGYTRQANNPIVGVNGAAMRVHGMYAYGQRVGRVTTRQLLLYLTNDTDLAEIHVSYDGGLTSQRLYSTAPGVVGTIPDFAQLGTYLVITQDSGVAAPQSWDGNQLATIVNSQIGFDSFGVLSSGQLSGNYQWKIVPIKADGTRKLASATMLPVALSNQKVLISWLADPDLTVSSYEVYRTTGTGKVYYYVGLAATRLTTNFTDNAHDLEIIGNRALAEYGEPPPVGVSYCESHAQRMWYGVSSLNPRTWYYSDPGLPNSVFAENKFDFTDAESFTDIGVGAVGNYKKMFVAFLERSIWTVSGSGTFNGAVIDFTRKRSDAITGAVSHRTVARVPAGSRFRNAKGEMQVANEVKLAYLTPRLDIRLFDGTNDTVISFPKSDTLKRLNYAHRRKSWVLQDKTRGELAWIFPADANTECSLAVVWNYQFGTWDEREWRFGHGVETDAEGEASVMLAGESLLATGALIYKLWNGTTFDGAAFTSQLMTTTLYGISQNRDQPTLLGQPLISFDKRWRWADVLLQLAGNSQLLVEWLPGEALDAAAAYGSRTMVNITQNVLTADGQVVRTADGQNVVVPIEQMMPFRVLFNEGHDKFSDGSANPRYLHSRGLRLRLSCVSSNGGFIGTGMNIAYQLLRGLKRDFVR